MKTNFTLSMRIMNMSLEKFDGQNADSMMQLQLQLKYDQVRSKLKQVDEERNNLLRLHSIEMTSKEYEMAKKKQHSGTRYNKDRKQLLNIGPNT